MDETEATSPATGEQPPAGEDLAARTPGFRARGQMRRRARFLRRARELAYRDLGGLVYNLHRFSQRNDALVLAKLETIARIDNELRALEKSLAERQPVTILHEAGVAACPRCAAIHGSDDRFCPNCGLAMDLRAERPVAGAAAPAGEQPPAPSPTSPPSATPAGAGPGTPAPMPAATPPLPAAVTARPTLSAATSTPAPATRAPATPSPASPDRATPDRATPDRRPTPAPTGAPAVAAPAGARRAGASGEDEPAPARATPSVDEPTEIIRPPVQSS